MVIKISTDTYMRLLEHAGNLTPGADISLMVQKRDFTPPIEMEDLKFLMLSENDPVEGIHNKQAEIINSEFSKIWKDVYEFRKKRARLQKKNNFKKYPTEKLTHTIHFQADETELTIAAGKKNMTVDNYVRGIIETYLHLKTQNDFEYTVKQITKWCSQKKDYIKENGWNETDLQEITRYLQEKRRDIEENIAFWQL